MRPPRLRGSGLRGACRWGGWGRRSTGRVTRGGRAGRRNRLGAKACQAIAGALERNSTLTSLSLLGNGTLHPPPDTCESFSEMSPPPGGLCGGEYGRETRMGNGREGGGCARLHASRRAAPSSLTLPAAQALAPRAGARWRAGCAPTRRYAHSTCRSTVSGTKASTPSPRPRPALPLLTPQQLYVLS